MSTNVDTNNSEQESTSSTEPMRKIICSEDRQCVLEPSSFINQFGAGVTTLNPEYLVPLYNKIPTGVPKTSEVNRTLPNRSRRKRRKPPNQSGYGTIQKAKRVIQKGGSRIKRQRGAGIRKKKQTGAGRKRKRRARVQKVFDSTYRKPNFCQRKRKK